MPDYNKVIEGLKHCKQGAKGCTNCPYGNPYDACQWILMQDAMDLLEYQQIHLDAFMKDQEPMEPICVKCGHIAVYRCKKCNKALVGEAKYCFECGQAVKW